jgi:hypothetical protein
LDGVFGPFAVGTGAGVVNIADAEVEAAGVVGLRNGLVGEVDGLVHVPEVGHMDGVLGDGGEGEKEEKEEKGHERSFKF